MTDGGKDASLVEVAIQRDERWLAELMEVINSLTPHDKMDVIIQEAALEVRASVLGRWHDRSPALGDISTWDEIRFSHVDWSALGEAFLVKVISAQYGEQL